MDSQTANLNEMEDIKDRAPKLSGLNRENPFGVPKNYFDDFYARLETKLEPTPIVKRPSAFIRYLKPMVGLAAGFALVFTLVYWPLNRTKNTQTASTGNYYFEGAEDADILSMFGNIDEKSLLAILDYTQEEESFSNDEIVEYLSSNMSSYDVYLNLTE
jgi:hypothetical protein